jgi:hypothetical protein
MDVRLGIFAVPDATDPESTVGRRLLAATRLTSRELST